MSMLRSFSRLRRLALVSSFALAGAACGGSEPIVEPTVEITGNYVATRFIVTPTGKDPIDVLARGGSLTIQIAPSKATTGTLIIPQSVFGSAQNVSMAGTVVQSGYALKFQQSADTFVRTVGWLAGGGTIATDVNDGSSRIEVTLTRQ
jgi:hypothetical protein